MIKRWAALPMTTHVRAAFPKLTLWYGHSVTIMVVLHGVRLTAAVMFEFVNIGRMGRPARGVLSNTPVPFS